MTIAYVHGRFQPFHKGHLALLKYALDNYEKLWVGISNPLRELPRNFSSLDKDLQTDLLRSRNPKKNIFTYLQREKMILKSLEYEGQNLLKVKVQPHFGYFESDNWQDFLPPKDDAVLVIHVKDLIHDLKLDLYKKLGWRIEQVKLFEEGVSGTQFHNVWPNGNWQVLVPKGTKEILEEILNDK